MEFLATKITKNTKSNSAQGESDFFVNFVSFVAKNSDRFLSMTKAKIKENDGEHA